MWTWWSHNYRNLFAKPRSRRGVYIAAPCELTSVHQNKHQDSMKFSVSTMVQCRLMEELYKTDTNKHRQNLFSVSVGEMQRSFLANFPKFYGHIVDWVRVYVYLMLAQITGASERLWVLLRNKFLSRMSYKVLVVSKNKFVSHYPKIFQVWTY